MNNNPLLCFTSFNKLDITKRCLSYKQDCDTVIIDDHSTDGTQKWLRDNGYVVWPKVKRMGLTDSWNRAYRFFKESDHSHLIISNNDVIIPKYALYGMMSDHVLTVPMTNHTGAGYVHKDQSVDFHLDTGAYDPGTIAHAQKIQNITKRGFKEIRHWTGFCMCFSRKIIEYEREDGNLIDPTLINVGNDDYLAKKVPAMLALGSFVYHLKGKSFNNVIANRDDLRKTY